MSTYLFAYRAPRDYQPGNRDEMIAWQTWFEELGDALVDAGNPIFSRTTIGAGTSDTDLGGYSLVTADNVDAAMKLAHGCPFMKLGGGVEIGEITPLSEDCHHHCRRSRPRHRPTRLTDAATRSAAAF